ncbi:AAA family ATPase [Methanohalophilus levihalophilus]|uniref:AAA family ATPase n=1 Tax=Methanohalophilus levihalophilus TaxID=1431282 RepID=UPI001AE8A777|nr:AAA family ATPase [Methanohalophilus levihalophilus]MBP2030167.1 AAA family ATPase [Methanohalophilus levihalophilus]
MIRSAQRLNPQKKRETQSETEGVSAELVVIKPAGYPMCGIIDDFPQVENPEVFECYARQQWNGYIARAGDYLFDHRMYPDFAYRIIDAQPPESIIGQFTSFIVNEELPEPQKIEYNTDVTFEDVIGQKLARQKCKLIEKYLEKPGIFGKWAPRNVLFFGPSGTGKTMLSKALANHSKVPIIPIKATQLIGEFVGEGSRQIHQLYEKAADLAPCIIFIDELDAVALDRRHQELRGDVAEVVNALLTEMDGIDERKGVCTICATNRPEVLDVAVRSRFEEEIEFILPEKEERVAIITKNLATFPLPANPDIGALATKTQGFSGRDLVEKVLKNALHRAIMDDLEEVPESFFEEAISKVLPKQEKDSRMYV